MVRVQIVRNAMQVELFDHQKEVIDKLESGKILVGGVGSGKSRTSLFYYSQKEIGKDLYIITTAKKRDKHEWEEEASIFNFKNNIVVDSWNNIHKYTSVKNSFFLFDEQRVIGNGTWVKSFIKISQNNNWLLLSATPGDTWMDYIPVFIANGFYKNRTEFVRRHVVFNNHTKFPKVDHFIEVTRLVRLRELVVVKMHYSKKTISHHEYVNVPFDQLVYDQVAISRWNIFEAKPIKDISELCYLMRKVVNSDVRRIDILKQLLDKHSKIIVFYNFNYERDLLLQLGEEFDISMGEWSGHKHQDIPKTDVWLYNVQYAAGAEGWNCIETNAMVFFSQSYSYKATIQAAGRIDRLNTEFTDLYYYHLQSDSSIDRAIKKAFDSKKDFNEKKFLE